MSKTGELAFLQWHLDHMDVSENSGTPKSSILIGFSIMNHPFWGTTIFGNTHMDLGQGKIYIALQNNPSARHQAANTSLAPGFFQMFGFDLKGTYLMAGWKTSSGKLNPQIYHGYIPKHDGWR